MADSIDTQIERILEGVYSGLWTRGQFSTYANVNGLGLVIANVLGQGPNLRMGVYVASGVPFSKELVATVGALNQEVLFGATTLYVGDNDLANIIFHYDYMLPWFDGMSVNHLGVFQPLLDIIGNLPTIAARVSDRILNDHGGSKPDLSDGWDMIVLMHW